MHMLSRHLLQVDAGGLRRPGPSPLYKARSFVGADTPGVASVSFLSHFKPLSAAQRAVAAPVFGTSIDFTFVYLSDFKGASGRAFTVAVAPYIVMNCGSFTPSDAILIHELVHVWQSQHHSIDTAFMVNSVQSQALALTENEALALADPTLKGDPWFPSLFPRSPDQYVIVKVVVPQKLSDRAKQLLEELTVAAPQNPRAGLW